MASNLIIARGAVGHVPPISLAFWRWFFVVLILLPFLYKKIFSNIKDLKKEWLKLFFLGSMACGVCGAFPFIAGKTTTATNMGIIYSSSPIFIIILSNIFFSEIIKKIQIIGLLICITGVLLIISKGDISQLYNLKFTSGDLWILGSAIGWALYSVYLLNWKSNFDIYLRFFFISFFGALSLLPFYFLEELYMNEQTFFSSNFLFWVLFGALSPGIIAFTMYTKVQKYLGASKTGFTLYLYALYAAFYGVILFGEKLESYHFVSACLVFFGIYLVNKKKNLIFNRKK